MQVREQCKELGLDALAYKPMKKHPRPSYDHAISVLSNSDVKMMIEPKNGPFSDKWGSYEGDLSSEERTNLTIYDNLRCLLD